MIFNRAMPPTCPEPLETQILYFLNNINNATHPVSVEAAVVGAFITIQSLLSELPDEKAIECIEHMKAYFDKLSETAKSLKPT